MVDKAKSNSQYQASLTQRLRNIPTGVLLTAEFLAAEFGSILNTGHLAKIFGVKEATIIQQISRGKFELKTSKIGKQHISTPFDVAMHLENNKV